MPHAIVVQYVPDAVMNERINIGVAVLHDGASRFVFLSNWNRVRQFAGKDVAFLKNLQHEARTWDESTVRRLSMQWTGSVQFSKPMFTTLDPDAALLDSIRRFLNDPTQAQRGYRDKMAAVRLIRRQIKETLVSTLGSLGNALIKSDSYRLNGLYRAYEFDVSVSNEQPLFAAQGISFEVPATRRLEKEITSTAWLIEDVRRVSPKLPIGVAVFPPKVDLAQAQDRFTKAASMFKSLGAEVLEESDIPAWTQARVNELPESLYRRLPQ